MKQWSNISTLEFSMIFLTFLWKKQLKKSKIFILQATVNYRLLLSTISKYLGKRMKAIQDLIHLFYVTLFFMLLMFFHLTSYCKKKTKFILKH